MNKRPLIKSMTSTDQKIKKSVAGVISGKVLHPSASTQEEAKRVLLENDVNLEFLVSKYKMIASSMPDKITASDVLKSLDTMMRILGVKTEDDQTVLKVGAILQEKTPTELRTFVLELTTKTQTYLNRVREPVSSGL